MVKPNIVIIMADQLAPQYCGIYGHPVAKTPHIDSLAKRGARFDAAYCNSPLCAPSRFSFMSGQLVSRIAAYDNASEFSAMTPTFAHYLRSLGYRTCLSGKMHFIGPDQKHGFEDRVTTDIYPSDFAWTPDWEAPDERIDKWYHNMQTVKESGMAVATFQTDYDDEVGFAANRWLIDQARDLASESSRPFALVASFIHPHDPYVAKPEWWNLYSNDEIQLPLTNIDAVDMDPFSKRLLDGIEASYTPLSNEEIIRARRAYLANVSYFDSKVGEIIKTIYDIGEIDNTVIIVTADHGDMLGERGLWYKMNFFEHSARVPMIFAGPNISSGVIKNTCSLVDILPTLIDIAGGSEDILGKEIDGRSLVNLLHGKEDPVDEAIGEYCAEMTAHPVFMIRRSNLKYIHCDEDPPQLYDLNIDPLETKNFANHPEYNEAVASFSNEVSSRWDSKKLREDIIKTQKSRRSLYEAMSSGKLEAWDYNPPSDASQQYVRNHMDWTIAASRYRFPPISGDKT